MDAMSTDQDPDADLVRAVVEALGQGDQPISRIAPFPHFTFAHEGDELLLTDALRVKVERELGCKLVERERTLRNLTIIYLTAATVG